MIRKAIRGILRKAGYEHVKDAGSVLRADMLADQGFMELYSLCCPYTMTSMERLYSLYHSVIYILENQIAGDLVECGVWKGGSSMMMAYTLLKMGVNDRKVYLYDTFEGMSEPGSEDRTFQGENAAELLGKQEREASDSIWCYSSLDEVKANLQKTGYPVKELNFVVGKVEETLLHTIPSEIALLRLDTDWYASTRAELEILYPLLSQRGILIVDDFGHWEGAKKAVLEYFKGTSPMLHRIDNTGRILIK